jgi:nucleoside-diphosphate-sugar epimerase
MNQLHDFFKSKRILVTGGAGFIGSNLVGKLLELGAKVRVFDNLETGRIENLAEFNANPHFEFMEGDIRDMDACLRAVEGVDAISHQAALGSVPRSIALPHMTHAVNATGFLNMLHAAKENGVQRFVFASSSSVYGDSTVSPKIIGSEGQLLSPYAVTKHLNEQYAGVYARLHHMETIGLRYFNVFGPKQDPKGVYAAAIPKFIDAMVTGGEITIHGDGEQTRDFTFVDNAVNANLLGLSTDNGKAFGKVVNVACGDYFSLNQVIEVIQSNLIIQERYNEQTVIKNGPPRPGDIRDSLADISETTALIGYKNPILFHDGMENYLSTYFN